MSASLDHILTSHAGSLPRPDGLIAANRARESRRGGRRAGASADAASGGGGGRTPSTRSRHRHPRRRRVRQTDGATSQLRVVVALFVAAARRHRARDGFALRHAAAPLGARRHRIDQLWRPARPHHLCRRLQRPGFGHHHRPPSAGAGLRCPARLCRNRNDPGRYRELQGGARGHGGCRRLYDRRGAGQLRPHSQLLLQKRRRVPLRLRRCDARGIPGDRRCRHRSAARRPVPRRRLGPGQPRAERRGLPEACGDLGRRAEPRDPRPAGRPGPAASVLGQLARAARHRHPDAGHYRSRAEGQCRCVFVRGRQCPPRARMEGLARRQAARRQGDPSGGGQPRDQRRRAPGAGRRTHPALRETSSAASGSSPRPIAASAGGSIRRSPGPSSKRSLKGRHWPAAGFGAER